MLKKPLKTFYCFILAALLLAILSVNMFGIEAVPRAQYLAYAKASADWTWQHYDEIIGKWKQTFDPKNVFGYRAPGGLLETAAIYSYLFEKERKPEYAQRAKKILLTYGDYRSEFPDWARKIRLDSVDGVPALPDFFTVMRYIRAYDTLHRLSQLAPDENAKAETVIAESTAYMLRTQEWGPMNRGHPPRGRPGLGGPRPPRL